MDFQTQYDEDLSQNKFFQTLQNEHKILIETAPLENWIICVPRSATIKQESLTDTDFLLAHILIPHDEVPEQYTNLLGMDIKQSNGKLLNQDVSSTILFEEVFYTKGLGKYKVWCIEMSLLHINTTSTMLNGSTVKQTIAICTVRGLTDAVQLIWSETNSKAVFHKIENVCHSFVKSSNYALNINSSSGSVRKEDLDRMQGSVEILLEHCFKKLLYQNRLQEKCSCDPYFAKVLKIALETYIMSTLYTWIFDAISVAYLDENEKFNRKLRNLTDLSLKDFKIDPKYNEIVGRVRVELLKINDFPTTIEKMGCLRRGLAAASRSKHNDISVDELIPILVFVIIKSGVAHWISILQFLKKFIFAELFYSSDKGVDSFLITTLEAAIMYIESTDLKEVKTSGLKNSVSYTPGQRKFSTKDDFIYYLFDRIKAGDEVEIVKLLKIDDNLIIELHIDDTDTKDQSQGTSFENGEEDVNHLVADEIDIICQLPTCRRNLQNSHGVGAIHVAAMHGLPKMLNLLLALSVSLKTKDENNFTALHYAAVRGHQSTLLLLLHAGIDINAVTNDMSTALHLSSMNGHGNCVKALLYYSDHMKIKIEKNLQNRMGDTALHLAVKWGFQEIVETLLEYGVKMDIRNRQGHTALEYAHNSFIASILQNAFVIVDRADDESFELAAMSNKPEVFKGCFTLAETNVTDNADVVFKRKTCNDKVVAAIRNGDTKLAYHFLGIDPPENIQNDCCHPLCTCKKCKHINLSNIVSEKNKCKMSLKYVGNINECSIEGITPLHAAIQQQNCELIDQLFELGALVNIQSSDLKQTALHAAILTNNNEIISLVLDHIKHEQNDIDIRDIKGDTALHLAVRTGDVKIVEQLLRHEPMLIHENKDGQTAQDIARSLFQVNISNLLNSAT